MYDVIYEFFEKLIGGDEWATRTLSDRSGGFPHPKEGPIFSLRGLFLTVCSERPNITYQAFRSALYSSQLNQDLMRLGYVVISYKSTGNVDTSWYQLTSRPDSHALE